MTQALVNPTPLLSDSARCEAPCAHWIAEQVASNVRQAIEESGVALRPIADAIGISPQTLNRKLRGRTIIYVHELVIIADQIDVCSGDLIADVAMPAVGDTL